MLNFSSLEESVLLSGESKQHHYQASAPWRTHRKTLGSSTSIQRGDGRRKQHSLQHGQDLPQHGTGCASSHKDPLRWRQEGEGRQGVRAVVRTCIDNVFLTTVKHCSNKLAAELPCLTTTQICSHSLPRRCLFLKWGEKDLIESFQPLELYTAEGKIRASADSFLTFLRKKIM